MVVYVIQLQAEINAYVFKSAFFSQQSVMNGKVL